MIDPRKLDALIARIEQAPAGSLDTGLAEGLGVGRLTICSEYDITGRAKPVHQGAGYALYLVDAGQTCACLTNDFENACGVVLALNDDDEDEG